MAEALVSVVLEQLVAILRQQIEAKVRLVAGVDEEIQTLTSNFQAIQYVLEDAEKRQVKEKHVKGWLDKLKHACYDIDDVLDHWNTEIQIQKLKKVENTSKGKVCSLIPSCCFSPNQVALRHNIANKIKDLNEMLANIAREKEMFNFIMMGGTRELERPTFGMMMGARRLERPMTTTTFSDELKVYGRDQDKIKIKNFLLSESSQGSTFPTISIVGMGGLGKTTLARFIFNDDEVSSYFDVKIWVCISNSFDEIRIAKAILETLKVDAQNLFELESLLQQIHQSITGKKFLLILDDVWTENRRDWEQLKGSLKYASQGSRILVTTRKEIVAKSMGTTNMIPLEKLSNEECWLLFTQVAFFGKTDEECKKFEDIGKTIVDKCNGMPLAVKTLGSLLSLKTNIEQWRRVLNSDLWKLEEIEEWIFSPLLLSYYDLSPILRKCFLYCTIFPKDYEIDKDELIKLWMAQGYLKVEGREDVELIGEEYFENLTIRSFFQDFERSKDDDRIISCKMHDIVYDVAQFLTKNEYFTLEVDNSIKSQSDHFPYGNIRHSMIIGDSIHISICNNTKLRSLLLVPKNGYGSNMIKVNLSKLFDSLTCLRALYFSDYSIKEISGRIKNLIHLRYLNLSYCKKLKELPKTLCHLYNLETLDLTFCERLEKLPRGIGKLINLRHLINICTFNLSYMPKGMEKLTCLHTLSKLVVSGTCNGEKDACTLECLKKLNHLQGSVHLRGLGDVTNADEVEKADLKSKKNLIDLSLSFDKKEDDEERTNEYLEAFQLPPNLEKLEIINYKGTTIFPSCMISLTRLRELTLRTVYIEYFPPLGKLPLLESLRVNGMKNVKRVSNEFLGIENDVISSSSMNAFPKLKCLHIQEMNEWEEWNYEIRKSSAEEITIMPCLHTLSIFLCEKLKALPDQLLQLTTLEQLEVKHCSILDSDELGIFAHRLGSTVLPNVRKLTLHYGACKYLPPLGKLPSLESLKISFMNNVKRVSNEFLGIETNGRSAIVFPKLKTALFLRMEEWEEWDITEVDEDITIMPCLQSLDFRFCNKLKALPNHILQVQTLQKLKIYKCSILEERYKKETGEDWPKVSHISDFIL